jgi:hypothetical protein
LRRDDLIRIQHFWNIRTYLIGCAALATLPNATTVFGRESPTVSDVGNWVVVLFGFFLWFSLLFTVCLLGIRAMLDGRYARPKRHRNRPSQ